MLSSPSAVFFELVAFPDCMFLCLFQTALIFFLNASVQKENGGELAEEKEALYAILTQV
ncbi:hypothetical protein [Desulfobaculum bizertense]|nr:hypothetical protein [Desulfobaculum bizertense]